MKRMLISMLILFVATLQNSKGEDVSLIDGTHGWEVVKTAVQNITIRDLHITGIRTPWYRHATSQSGKTLMGGIRKRQVTNQDYLVQSTIQSMQRKNMSTTLGVHTSRNTDNGHDIAVHTSISVSTKVGIAVPVVLVFIICVTILLLWKSRRCEVNRMIICCVGGNSNVFK